MGYAVVLGILAILVALAERGPGVTRWLLVLLLAGGGPIACLGQASPADADASPSTCGDTARSDQRLDALRQAIFPETDDELLIGYGDELRRRMPGLGTADPFAMVTDAATCARVVVVAPGIADALVETGVSLLRLGPYLAVVRWRSEDGWIHDPYAEIIDVLDARTFRVVPPASAVGAGDSAG